MKTTIDGIDTHYERIGAGPMLMLLHGWGGSWGSWSQVIPALSECCELILPDLPGFGDSAYPPTAWSSWQYAQWLNSFVKEIIGSAEFALGGHSLGGKIATIYAAQHPQQLRQLILIDAAGIPLAISPFKQFQKTMLRLVPAVIKDLIPHTVKYRMLTASHSSTDYFLATQQQRTILRGLIKEDIREIAPNVTTPTLLIWGANDEATPLKHGRELAALIPSSELKVLNKSGHFPFIDETDEFLTILRSVL